MTRLTQKGVNFEWDDLCEKAFQEFKRRLTTTPILIVPKQGQKYTMYCDASRDGLGCVLSGVSGHCLFPKDLVPLLIW